MDLPELKPIPWLEQYKALLRYSPEALSDSQKQELDRLSHQFQKHLADTVSRIGSTPFPLEALPPPLMEEIVPRGAPVAPGQAGTSSVGANVPSQANETNNETKNTYQYTTNETTNIFQGSNYSYQTVNLERPPEVVTTPVPIQLRGREETLISRVVVPIPPSPPPTPLGGAPPLTLPPLTTIPAVPRTTTTPEIPRGLSQVSNTFYQFYSSLREGDTITPSELLPPTTDLFQIPTRESTRQAEGRGDNKGQLLEESRRSLELPGSPWENTLLEVKRLLERDMDKSLDTAMGPLTKALQKLQQDISDYLFESSGRERERSRENFVDQSYKDPARQYGKSEKFGRVVR